MVYITGGRVEKMSNLKVALFVSRNKDNKKLEGFKERRVSFLTDKTVEELQDDFKDFVRRGSHRGEVSRFYISVNSRDEDKIRKGLIHYLVDHEDLNMAQLERRVASIASLKENAKEKKWLFDFDEEPHHIHGFISDIYKIAPTDTEVTLHDTPNGYAVIVSKGFDTRSLLSKWKNVELKRDDMLCVDWKTKHMLDNYLDKEEGSK